MSAPQATRVAGPRPGDAFGALLQECFAAGVPAGRFYEICEREDGHIGIADATCFFAGPDGWPAVDQWALGQVAGRILDVGVGAGRFALALQESGADVVGLDVSTGAIEVSRARGLRSVIRGSLGDLAAGAGFDTFLLMGRNIGLFEGRERAPALLTAMTRVARPGARIVGTALDPDQVTDPRHRAYFAANLRRGRLPGQMRFRLRHRRLTTGWYDYLFTSIEDLERLLAGTGWWVADVHRPGGLDYGVVLQLEMGSGRPGGR